MKMGKGVIGERILFNRVLVKVSFSEVLVIVGFFGFFKIIFFDVLVGCIDCYSF